MLFQSETPGSADAAPADFLGGGGWEREEEEVVVVVEFEGESRRTDVSTWSPFVLSLFLGL